MGKLTQTTAQVQSLLDRISNYPKSKSATLQSSAWSQSGSLYRQLITDADIVDGSVLSGGVDATDTVSYDAWTAAEGITGVFDTTTAGQFYVYAKTAPTANINYKYTISL